MTQMNHDVLIRLLDIAQNRFLRGASNSEFCWLMIAKCVCPGRSKICSRQGRKSQAGCIKKIEGKLFERGLGIQIWYLYLFFSSNGLMCWQWLLAAVRDKHLCFFAKSQGSELMEIV